MSTAAERLRKILESAPARLKNIPDAGSEEPFAPGKWSRKRILGHLIDSASNNHQRFVRSQLASPLIFPGYEQDGWVRVQQYEAEKWTDMVGLWTSYNAHLLHVLQNVPDEKWEHRCIIGEQEPVTLEFLANDYVRHLEHHLAQILNEKSPTATRT
jgi:hypothetical protein